MTGLRKIRVVGGLMLPLLSLFYLAWSLVLAARVPDASDWMRAAEVVRSGARPNDIVLFSPAWAQEGVPAFYGLDVWTSEVVDWYEIGKHPRLWVVGAMGHRFPEVPAAFAKALFEDFGRVTVSMFELPTRRLAYSFIDRLRNAQVEYGYREGPFVATQFTDEQWRGRENPDWCYVGARFKDIGGGVRRAIWAHPPNQDQPLTIRYPTVPIARTLVIHYGMAQNAMDEGKGIPLVFDVLVGDRQVLQRVADTSVTFWARETIDLSDLKGQGRDVTFRVRTPDHDHQHFMFTADLWDEPVETFREN